MCCSATLAIEMSSTSMKAAKPTVTATSHGLNLLGTPVCTDRIGALLSHPHTRHDRHPGAQREMRIGRRVEDDLDRHALYHLDVVPGSILRRQQVESGAASGLE